MKGRKGSLPALLVVGLVVVSALSLAGLFATGGWGMDGISHRTQRQRWALLQTWEADYKALLQEKEGLLLRLQQEEERVHVSRLEEYSSSSSHAVVTIFGPSLDRWEPAAHWIFPLVMFKSLEETGCRIKHKLAFSRVPLEEIPESMRLAFADLSVQLRYLGSPGPIDFKSEDEAQIWARSRLFSELTEFSRVLFIDNYSLLVENVDHVLDQIVETKGPSSLPGVLAARQQPGECQSTHPCMHRVGPSPRFYVFQPNVRALLPSSRLTTWARPRLGVCWRRKLETQNANSKKCSFRTKFAGF